MSCICKGHVEDFPNHWRRSTTFVLPWKIADYYIYMYNIISKGRSMYKLYRIIFCFQYKMLHFDIMSVTNAFEIKSNWTTYIGPGDSWVLCVLFTCTYIYL